MAFFRKIKAGLVKSEIAEYIGEEGNIFFNIDTGELRLSDGVTPGGLPIYAQGTGGNGVSLNVIGSVPLQTDLDVAHQGAVGDTLVVQNTGNFWLWDGDQWIDIGVVQAPQGYTGSQGDIGYTGSQGTQGDVGYTGSQGTQGDVGYTGSQGAVGYTGSQGAVGYTGSQGAVGYTGSAGRSAYEIAIDNGFNGTEQEWVDSLGESLTVEPNAGLNITSGTITTVYNSQISDDVQSIAVGGAVAQSASVWKSKNIVEVLDTILFPDVTPTYTVPTLTVSGTQSGTKEIGSTLTQSLSLIAVENDAGAFTLITLSRGATQLTSIANPTGTLTTSISTQFGYANPNNPNYSYSLTASDPVTVINGSISWSGSGTYGAGVAKQNNKGVTDTRTSAVRSTSAPQSASSISGSTITVTGIYPYFWGKSSTQPTASSIASAIAAGTANKVLAAASGTLSVTYSAVGEYVWLAHAASYTTKTKWYNTELNQGNIGAGNFILSPVTQSVTSPDAYWSNINFSVYISDGATTTNGALQFRNS